MAKRVAVDIGKEQPGLLTEYKWQGEEGMDLRHLWFTPELTLARTKKAFRVPYKALLPIITTLIHWYNEHEGTQFQLVPTTDEEVDILNDANADADAYAAEYDDDLP